MDDRVTRRPAVPPARKLEDYSGRVALVGARSLPQFEPSTEVPNLGPYTLHRSACYDLQAFPGPLLKMVTVPSSGLELDVQA